MVPFLPWTPDAAVFQTDVATEALNVIPSANGFRPFPSFVSVTTAVDARVQGAFSVKSLGGTIYNFCATATKLYKMDSNGLAWSDVTRTVGGDYTTPSDRRWSFTQYGDYVLATNGADAVQVFQMGVSTNFAALGGSPPQAYYTGTIREFGVLAKTSSQNNRIRWSAIGNIADWVSSPATLSDYQDLPDGGSIIGFAGGEFGIVFQERAIQRMSFEGPPTTFRFDKISTSVGCRAEGSIASYDNTAFFLADDGVYMIQGGAQITPIGAEKVDRWIEANLDASYLDRVSSAIDPINKLYLLGIPTNGSSEVVAPPVGGGAPLGTPNAILVYHWPTGQWSHAAVYHELVYQAATQAGFTIDGMDAVAATIDAIPYPMDSRFWTGSGRLLLAGFDTDHKFGFYSGGNLPAVMETGDSQLNEGGRALLRGLRPMIEGTSVEPAIIIGSRNDLGVPVSYSNQYNVNPYNFCNTRVNARYHRVRLTIASNDAWDYARGVDDIKFSPMGRR